MRRRSQKESNDQSMFRSVLGIIFPGSVVVTKVGKGMT